MTLPIVFVHGIRVSGSMWHTLAPRLAADHRVATPDLPGHGTRRGEPFAMDTATGAIAACIDQLGGRALLVGLSLGGYVGIATAARYPSKVAGLVAMGCTSQPDRWTSSPYRLIGWLAARDPEWANRLSARGIRRSLPEPLARAFLAGGQSCEVISQVIPSMLAEDYLSALASYPGPVWLLNGSRDPFRLHEQAFLRACADGQLIVIPRRGHLTTLIDADDLANRFSTWATQLAGKTGPRPSNCATALS